MHIKRVGLCLLFIFFLGATLGSAQTVVSLYNSGKARVFIHADRSKVEWVKKGMVLNSDDVIQVGNDCYVRIQLSGQMVTLTPNTIVKVSQLILHGNLAIRQIRTSSPSTPPLPALGTRAGMDGTSEKSSVIKQLFNHFNQKNYNAYLDLFKSSAMEEYLVYYDNELAHNIAIFKALSEFYRGYFNKYLKTMLYIRPEIQGRYKEILAYCTALSYYFLDDFSKAEPLLKEWVSTYPKSEYLPEVYLYLGYIYMEKGNTKEATTYFTLANQSTKDETIRSETKQLLKKTTQ